MTPTHITPSDRVKDEFGRELWTQQSSRERSKAEPGRQMPKVANKNEPTTLVGDTAGTQPTLNIYF